MIEFLRTGKRHEELKRAEEGARGTLQEFLDSNYKAVRAMRAYTQTVYLGQNPASPQLEDLKSFVNRESKGQLECYDGTLCEIGEWGEEFADSHSAVYFGKDRVEHEKAIRGFWFGFNLQETEFECVVLDHGRSRTYFDEKDKSDRRQYVERFANRRRNEWYFKRAFKIWEKLPLWFTAFLTDTGEGLVIEEIVAHRNKQRLKKWG